MWKRPRIHWRGKSKRIATYTALALAILLAGTILLMTAASHLAARNSIWEIRTDWRADLQSSFTWHGAGWSLSERHGSNLLQHSDFAGYTVKFSTPVLRVEEGRILVSMRTEPDQQPYSQALLGSTLSRQNVNTAREDVQCEDPHLVRFQNARLQLMHRSGIRTAAEGERILSGASRSIASGVQDSVFVGSHGLVYYDAQAGDPRLQPAWTEEDLVEVAGCDSGYVVRSASGRLWGSADGQHWQSLPFSGVARVLGGQRTLWILDQEGNLLVLRSDWATNWIAQEPDGVLAAATIDGDVLRLPLRSGECHEWAPTAQKDEATSYVPEQATSFEKSESDGPQTDESEPDGQEADGNAPDAQNPEGTELVESRQQWILGTQFGAEQYCVDEKRRIWQRKGGRDVQHLKLVLSDTNHLPEGNPRQFFYLGANRPALVLDSGLFFWDPDRASWQELRTPDDEAFQAAFLFPHDVLVGWTDAGTMQTLSLQTELEVEDVNWALNLRAGDRISLIQPLAPAVPPVGWKVEDETRVLPWQDRRMGVAPDISDEPRQALLLGPQAALHQTLQIRQEQWPERGFVTLRLRARPFVAADGMRRSSLEDNSDALAENRSSRVPSSNKGIASDTDAVSLQRPRLCLRWTGPDGRQQSFELQSWETDGWTQGEWVFVAGDWADGSVSASFAESAESHTAELELELQGSTPLLLSDVYLGISPVHSGNLQLDDAVFERIRNSQPDVLRLGSVHIGANGRGKFAWLLPETEGSSRSGAYALSSEGLSLLAALDLARESGGDPWIVLEPNTAFDEVLGLLEYLAGPTTSPFGALRASQGEVIPWSTQFQRIYLEFAGSEQEAVSDREQADNADALLHVAQSSPYYQSMKNQLVFVDGISYSRQEKLTRADEHGSQVPRDFGEGLTVEGTYQALQSLFPRQNLHPEEGGAREVLCSVPLTDSAGKPHSLAHLVQFSLTGMGRLTHLILFDWERGAQGLSDAQLRALQQVLAPVPGGSHLLPLSRRLEPGHEEDPARLERIGSFASLSPEGRPHLVFTNTNSDPMRIRFTSENRSIQVQQTRYDSQGQILDQVERTGASFLIEIPAGGVVEWQGETIENAGGLRP